ncbi:hypothetical protein VNO77_08130 [Canavalia gladiata]|uniref:Uncharacterized protein n=1 Tax=Canavalia gladiata TaxID=3824 RepID=A0AAN9R0X2_CANGL
MATLSLPVLLGPIETSSALVFGIELQQRLRDSVPVISASASFTFLVRSHPPTTHDPDSRHRHVLLYSGACLLSFFAQGMARMSHTWWRRWDCWRLTISAMGHYITECWGVGFSSNALLMWMPSILGSLKRPSLRKILDPQHESSMALTE